MPIKTESHPPRQAGTVQAQVAAEEGWLREDLRSPSEGLPRIRRKDQRGRAGLHH